MWINVVFFEADVILYFICYIFFMRFLSKILLIGLSLSGIVLADAIKPSGLSMGGAVARDLQLSEIRDIMRGGRGGYWDLGLLYLPFRTQTPLLSEYGEHEGFAFRHHLAAFGSGEVAPDKHLGMLLWYERSGWDGEDFFLFPQYNDFSIQRSVVTWGFTFTDSRVGWTLAAGMQHQNVEHVGRVYPHEDDSLAYSWAHLRFGRASAQANFYRTDWRLFRFSLDLESRAVYGGAPSGPSTYLPNVSLAMYNDDSRGDVDSLRLDWEQNLYGQRLYAEVAFDLLPGRSFHSAAFKFYPDPSRMVGFEATCLRRHLHSGSNDFLWGGAIDLLFARFAYNAAYDYEHLFGTKGTFLVEFKFNLASIDGMLFNRGGTRSAPLETNVIKPMDQSSRHSEITPLNADKSGDAKTVDARGIRYEKPNSASNGGTVGGPAGMEGGK